MLNISFTDVFPFFPTEALAPFEIKIHFLEYMELMLIKMAVKATGISEPQENIRPILFFKGHGQKLEYT